MHYVPCPVRSWSAAVVVLGCLAYASGCKHGPAATGAAPGKPAAPAPVVIPAAPAPPSESQAAATQRAIDELMRDHFDLASQARDAVLRGQLALAQAPLLWLGQHGYSKDLPASWRPQLDQIEAAARRANDQSSLETSAEAVAEMAAACGACHTAQGKGPHFEPSDFTDLGSDAKQKPRAALRGRMEEQVWAMECMWQGLVGPWDVAWQQGAHSLQELHGHRGLRASLAPLLGRVSTLGQAALAARAPAERAKVYGQLLAVCGGCHAGQGVDPGTIDTTWAP